MGYLNEEAISSFGFLHVGLNVLISDKASIYDADQISIGDNCRIDDFCVLAGKVTLGRNVHVAVFCNIAGGREGVTLGDFCGLSYGCHIVAQSDDYSGRTMTNPTVPAEFKDERSEPVVIGPHAILGTGSIVLPGVTVGEGVSSGAGTIFTRSTGTWGIYVGAPARLVRERSRDLLRLCEQYLAIIDQ